MGLAEAQQKEDGLLYTKNENLKKGVQVVAQFRYR